nr:DUF1566 domain-containing protein [Thioalkalivibrio sp.]
MKPTRSSVRWILSICAALLSTSAIADIPPAANECVPYLVETTPSADFTALEGGEVVRHEPTGLEWRRCAEGMSWTGTGCTGSANTWIWQAALRHADAVSGWRLPSISELRTIVERCRTGPAINQQVFPNTPSPSFWSSSPSAERSDLAWGVNFHNGSDLWLSKSHPFRVRLVRGG